MRQRVRRRHEHPGSDGPGAAWADGDWGDGVEGGSEDRGGSKSQSRPEAWDDPAPGRPAGGATVASLLQPTSVWYRLHPALALAVAGLLFAAISVVRVAVGSGETATVLYVLPIALLAVTYGRWGGWLGAAVGLVLFSIFAAIGGSEDLDPAGLATRVVAMVLLGGLLGHAVDGSRALEHRLLDEQRRRLELEEAERREREALEINDSIIQGMVGAKWLAEGGEAESAATLLDRTIEQGQRLVSELLTRAGPDADAWVVRSGRTGGQAADTGPSTPSTSPEPGAQP